MQRNVVLDDRTISQLFTQVENIIQSSREDMNNIVSLYKTMDTYSELMKSKDLLRIYGETADSFSKLCFLHQGAKEAMSDMKQVKREVLRDNSGLIPSMVKTYKYRCDAIIEDLQDFCDACQSARQGMDARVRYLSSITYGSWDKFKGAQC